ncbi:MAG TPA: GTP-binding protein [Gaiellaceae bacterium]|nr:GTP-binding protein [Gaiellaceae bacterium]
MAERLPVVLVTGFLGSGKTTLLSRLLGRPELGETAVIVNELGEVAIDHHLLRRVDERTVLLGNGCICCTLRGDLADELRDLLSRRTRGEIPPFRRVLVETTGLADPAPVLNTLLAEPVVRSHFEPGAVIATVDALNGDRQLDREAETLKQVLVADRLVVTKADLAERGPVDALVGRLRGLNPAADLLEVSFGETDPALLLAPGEPDPRHLQLPEATSHADVRPFVLFLDRPVDWTAFGIWLTMLLASRGADVLRVKGLLDVGGPGPVVLNGVQHLVYPPEHLDAWPDDDRRSRLVFIARGIGRDEVEESLAAFDAAARQP